MNTVFLLGTEVKSLSSLDFVDNLLIEASNGSLKVPESYWWFSRKEIVEAGSYVFSLRHRLKPLEGESFN